MLHVAEEMPNDADSQCRMILAVILNGFYERYHNLINFLFTRVYRMDPRKCKALFSSIPVADRHPDRNELLREIQDQSPELFNALTPETTNELSEKLLKQIQDAKDGYDIDFELIRSIRENDSSNLLLGIRAIREYQTFNNEFIPYLMKCSLSKDISVVGAASKALRTVCEQNPAAAGLISASFVPTTAALKAFSHAIQFAEASDVAASLTAIHDPLVKAIHDPVLKYSALSVLANAVSHGGDQYRTFAGELSPINAKLLAAMIELETIRQ
jgi:hypothetical protein